MPKRRNLRSRLAALGLAAATTAVTLGLAAPAAAAGTGSISGRVVDGIGNPLEGICVQADGGPPVTTDSLGEYTLAALETGSYLVRYSDCNPSPFYAAQWYLGRIDAGSADPVAVTDTFDTQLADAVLDLGVVVSGTVTDEGGVPIPNVGVHVTPTGPGQAANALTAGDGTYATIPLPAGSYTVEFVPADPQWGREFWDDQPTSAGADPVVLAVSDGPVHGGVDAQLIGVATIEGTVTGTGGMPLGGMCVDANVPSGSGGVWDGVGSTQTAPDGTYSMIGLPAVDVRVRFHHCVGGPYVEQWYSNQNDFESATPIALTPGALETGIDAQLTAGITVSGTVTDAGGTPVQNVAVAVQPDGSGPGAWGQTDSFGNYTTSGLPPGDYRVQFIGTGLLAGEWWNDQAAYDNADILTLDGGGGPVHGGVDASLATAASVSGRVTDSGGGPIAGICVSALVDTYRGPDSVANATTAVDGTYTMSGVPPIPVKIEFDDCSDVGPYVGEWWLDQPDFSAATPIALTPGQVLAGIDAELADAAVITGTVTDGSAQPLEDICAQASTTTSVGGYAKTDSSGQYQIALARPGDYRVQFVDCNDTPTFEGQWWDGQSSPATAQTVPVAEGQTVAGIDAVLAPGATGSISGKALSARDVGMTTACALAYLPDDFLAVAPVQPDGTYTLAGIPSGTYALAFVGCDDGEPQEFVPDPDVAGISYTALWWEGVPLTIPRGNDGGPDPLAQGANLVTVAPGADLTGHDVCFGCEVIDVTSITPGPDPNALAFAFVPPDLDAAGSAGAAGPASASVSASASASASAPASASAALAYTVTCTPAGGGAATTASGSGSPLAVSGLIAGATYDCRVAAAATGLVVATSEVLDASIVAGSQGSADPTNARPTSGALPRTGAGAPLSLARSGGILLLLGLVLAGLDRGRRRSRRRARFR